MARCSCAPPPRPPDATLIQAARLPVISLPPPVQSRRFFRLPASAPAYSGTQNRIASAAAIRCRRSRTGGGSGSRSSSGLNAGRAARPSYRSAAISSAATACTVRRAAALPEDARVLPDTSKICTRQGYACSCLFPAGGPIRYYVGSELGYESPEHAELKG